MLTRPGGARKNDTRWPSSRLPPRFSAISAIPPATRFFSACRMEQLDGRKLLQLQLLLFFDMDPDILTCPNPSPLQSMSLLHSLQTTSTFQTIIIFTADGFLQRLSSPTGCQRRRLGCLKEAKLAKEMQTKFGSRSLLIRQLKVGSLLAEWGSVSRTDEYIWLILSRNRVSLMRAKR